MLSHQNRLKKERDFKKVLKSGNGLRQKNIFFKFLANDLDKPRFGFVVSKKISNKAVVRNRVKRQMREAVRNILPRVDKNIDGAFIALKGIEQDNFNDIEQAVVMLLQKAEIARKF